MSEERVTILHNPACGTSRNTVRLITAAGITPDVVDYLNTPPTRDALRGWIDAMGVSVRAVIRDKERVFADLVLERPEVSDEALLDAMVAHPVLINRPIVISPRGVNLCRPSELALDLLPPLTAPGLVKEDGAAFLRDRPIAPTGALRTVLADGGLPADELKVWDLPAGETAAQEASGRRLFAYTTLDGAPVGYAGFALYGDAALLRPLLVLPERRGQRAGRNILLLLMRRAFDLGAREAYVHARAARPFFEARGFSAISPEAAPEAIRAEEAAALAQDAVLLRRRMSV